MSGLEIAFKIFITIVVLLIIIFFFKWLWTHQIDPIETLKRWFKSKSQDKIDWIATRDPNSIYQKRKIVGKVDGLVQENAEDLIIPEIYNAQEFNYRQPFEYKRYKLVVISIGRNTGMKINMVNGITETRTAVFENIKCKILSK